MQNSTEKVKQDLHKGRRPSVEKALRKIDPKLFRRFGIQLAYLFGSHASGKATSTSDLDIAVLFDKKQPAMKLFEKIALFRHELIKRGLGPLDIAILDLASPLLKYEVKRSGKVLYVSDDEKRALFEIRVYRDYDDWCFFSRHFSRRLQQELSKA